MKALKNDSTLYLKQIASAIAECYERDEKPRNRTLLELYTRIGQCICCQGEKAFIPHLAELLTGRFPSLKSFSPKNLRRMRDFYRTYENNPALMSRAQSLGWTQNTVILECCETDEQRSFYIDLATGRNLSKLALMKAIQEDVFADALHTEKFAESMGPSFAPVNDIRIDEEEDTTASVGTACGPFVTACEPPRQGNTLFRGTGSGYSEILTIIPTGRRMKNVRKQSISCWQAYPFPMRFISPNALVQIGTIHLKPPPDLAEPKKLQQPFGTSQARIYQWKVRRAQTAA